MRCFKVNKCVCFHSDCLFYKRWWNSLNKTMEELITSRNSLRCPTANISIQKYLQLTILLCKTLCMSHHLFYFKIGYRSDWLPLEVSLQFWISVWYHRSQFEKFKNPFGSHLANFEHCSPNDMNQKSDEMKRYGSLLERGIQLIKSF